MTRVRSVHGASQMIAAGGVAQRVVRVRRRHRGRGRGAAIAETLVALPALLLIGLAITQFALIYHGHHALRFAAQAAARAGALAHGDADRIEAAFAQALVPFLYGATNPADWLANTARAATHVAAGRAAGWIEFKQLSPTDASFDDWSEPARDRFGELIGGVSEIPIDNLPIESVKRQPNSGTAMRVGQAPVGVASGQTLADATLLKVRWTYGMPLVVPLIGRLLAQTVQVAFNCSADDPLQWATAKFGQLDAGVASESAVDWRCAYLQVSDGTPRLPIRVQVIERMHTPPRRAEGTGSATRVAQASALRGDSLGRAQAAPDLGADMSGAANRAHAGADGSAQRGPGFLHIGGGAAGVFAPRALDSGAAANPQPVIGGLDYPESAGSNGQARGSTSGQRAGGSYAAPCPPGACCAMGD